MLQPLGSDFLAFLLVLFETSIRNLYLCPGIVVHAPHPRTWKVVAGDDESRPGKLELCIKILWREKEGGEVGGEERRCS